MKTDAVDAGARFDNTAFSNEVVDGRALSLTATYTCPRCGEKIGFSKRDFEHRAQRRISNLSPSIEGFFNEWASQNGQADRAFLDWTCPGCSLAVRVYVEHWAGGRHGDAGLDLRIVLEAEQPA